MENIFLCAVNRNGGSREKWVGPDAGRENGKIMVV